MTTWKPTVAGILEIVAGALQLVTGVAVVLFAGLLAGGMSFEGVPGALLVVPLPLIGGVGLPLLLLGVVSIIGGISAVQRKRWGLALAGGICALVYSTLLGVLSIVFVVLSRDEF